MALPSMRPLYDRVYLIYAASLTAAASPSFVAAARGAVIRLHYAPLVAPATSTTNITPQLNGTPMQLNGVNVAYQIPAASPINVDVGPHPLRQNPQALLTMLYRSTDRLCRCGAPMKNLTHSASFESLDKNAPSKPGIKHLERPAFGSTRILRS